MERGQETDCPLLQQTDVVEKRMEMVATLLNRVNEEANLGQAMNQIDEDKGRTDKQGPQMKEWLFKMFNAVRSFAK
ncbi:hypothetical protein ACFSL6_08175 [Paenibacillus thailandensis]|uniref:Uncharacterized protein n=1 Tax=Paenibacillus thailandensis TaxID=393250 RepID=A0ABW5QUP7_9BACL